MHRFRSAFVITGFVILGLGSNLAWHYPRPEALGLKTDSPQQLVRDAATLESSLIRCRPNADWTDLLVERSDLERASKALEGRTPMNAPQPAQTWQTPPALLADLAHLPGVREANVVLRDGQEALVMLSMQKGAFAGEGELLTSAVETVQSYQPKIKAENVKLLDDKGADLNYTGIPALTGPPLPWQANLQQRLDSLLGARRSVFLCRLQRGKESRLTVRSVLYLRAATDEQQKAAQELVSKAEQKWVDDQNALLKTDRSWLVKDLISAQLGEWSRRQFVSSWQADRLNGLTLEPCEYREMSLVQQTLALDEMQMLRWSLTAPPPTPGQLALGLTALAPALFGWCLAVPWLLRRHQLSKSTGAPL